MTSERKIAANRRNGRKSHGPRTVAGRRRSSRNALRHGLSTISVNNPIHAPEIEKIAAAICDGDDDPAVFRYAVEIAECELIMNLVAAERIAAVERLRDPTQLARSRQRGALLHAYVWRKEARLAYFEYECRAPGVMKKIKSAAAGEPVTFAEVPDYDWRQVAVEERDEFDALQAAMPDIEKLERYERRAWSRYRRAVQALVGVKAARRRETERPRSVDFDQAESAQTNCAE